jgi:transposase
VKIEIAIERTGVPIGVMTAAANEPETALLEPVLDSIPEGVALPLQTPVIVDRSYDSDPLRADLDEHDFILISPHRKNRVKKPTNDGRRMRRYQRRWLVERSIAWLHSFRRVTTRREYYSFLFTGFVHLACALIAISRL